MVKTVKRIAVVRDPSKEPYPSPFSKEQRATLSPQEHLHEVKRASAKEAAAKHQAQHALEGPFEDPDQSAASAGGTVGLSLRSVSAALDLWSASEEKVHEKTAKARAE